jgi:NADH-quinone oxidoreductase subunit L
MLNLIPYILLLPLVGFVLLGLAGRALPQMLIALVGCGTVLVAFVLAVVQFVSMLGVAPDARSSDLILYNWITSGTLRIDVGLLLDPLSAVMLLIVTGVGFLIHVYSVGYMEDDPGYWRFFAFLNFFIFAMALLVAADNFLLLLGGWAGVGLASFLLIGFWYTRPAAVAAARKAFVVNVIGDFGLMLAIFLIFGAFGTLAYFGSNGVLNHVSAASNPGLLAAIALLLFVAAAAKSAQIPLQVWLPDAMEGPTPVSALIHAATMVTAGVYLIARASALFSAAPYALAVVGAIGAATALYAASIACVQSDIKRVLAYSTMSQLGYMFLGEAAGNFSAGIFHLTTHAYFKALLFMAAGAVIHALGGEQDMRKMGGLARVLPQTYWMFVIGGLALAAIVPFAGFWSKDAILGSVLQRAVTSGSPGWWTLYAVGLFTSGLTGYYIFRLIFVVFRGQYRGGVIVPHGPAAHAAGAMRGTTVHAHMDQREAARSSATTPRDPLARVHEVGAAMRYPMLALAALSIVGGFYGTPFWNWLGAWLAPVVHSTGELTPGDGLLWISVVLGLAFSLSGIAIAWTRYWAREPGFATAELSRHALVGLIEHRYYVDEIYDAVFVRPVVLVGRALRVGIEDYTLDGGTRGLAGLFAWGSRKLRRLQTGYARTYALAIVLGAALILAFYIITLLRLAF